MDYIEREKVGRNHFFFLHTEAEHDLTFVIGKVCGEKWNTYIYSAARDTTQSTVSRKTCKKKEAILTSSGKVCCAVPSGFV